MFLWSSFMLLNINNFLRSLGYHNAIFNAFNPFEYHPADSASDFKACKGRPTAFGLQRVAWEDVFDFFVYFDVGLCLGWQVEDAAGVGVKQFDYALVGQSALRCCGEHQRQGRFQSRYSWGRILLVLLFSKRMRGMVAGNAVNGGIDMLPGASTSA